jgi:molecular chaperone GrpE
VSEYVTGDRNEQEEPRVVIRDKRRIDPTTGQLRETVDAGEQPASTGARQPAQPAEDAAAVADDLTAELQRQVDERTADLQRVTAEYANYRRRVDRDRIAVGEQATGSVLATLLPVLDDIDRARQHGDLTGPFQAVAESLESALSKLGLVGFGEPGDAFDPNRHEAVAHSDSPDVSEPTCVHVMRRGYLLGERLLRPAMVAVAAPAEADGDVAAATEADEITPVEADGPNE